MNILKTNETNKITLTLEGRLDTTTAPELEAAVLACSDEAESLVLDFQKLEYISSAGLRTVLRAQKSMSAKGGMKIVNVNREVMEVFKITGFATILTIE